MPSTSHPSRPYQAHREQQRERILSAAERLFIDQGIDGASISDIARAAHVTRKTVYEYFPNKQEIAWAILQQIFKPDRARVSEGPEGSGFEQVERIMLRVAGQVEDNPAHLRFLVEFNSLYAREASAERMRQVTGRAGGGEDPVARRVRQGIADGSIRPDLDPEQVSAQVWNLVSGMNARFALLGSLITEEYGQPAMEIYLGICRTFLRGIQSTPKP